MIRTLMLAAALLIGSVLPMHADADKRINVVTSFSILADFAKNVGGDRVQVSSLVGPNGDSHVYTPTPADVKTIGEAAVVIVNGWGFEGWLNRLAASARNSSRGGKITIVEATKNIPALKDNDPHDHDHGHHHAGEIDPHAWQSVENAKIYVQNIRDALIKADPEGAAAYRANSDAYVARLDALDREVQAAVASIPKARRKVISSHDAFGYFASRYGIAFLSPQGVSTDSEPSARDVAAIIRQIKSEKIPAVFMENISDPRLMNRIASETGAKIGGTLYTDSLTDENGPAPTYIAMVRHNIKALTSALAD